VSNLTDAKVVLITGAAGNLGRAAASAFARTGAKLALTDRDSDRLGALRAELGLSPERCAVHAADITRLDATVDLCRAIASHFGRIDVAVHIAGGFRMGPVHETPAETWDLMMDLNARSAFNIAHGAVPVMKDPRDGGARGGRIIFIGSRAAHSGGPGVGVYAASKAAVLRLTESMAAELREHSINVNAVLPSVIDTPQNRQAMPEADPRTWVTPESIAEVILFLASPAARDISGASIPVYGRA
jgi:NAD(P)-dependent dehydrogenase (short-subunit alcohol dehydrogenase family)